VSVAKSVVFCPSLGSHSEFMTKEVICPTWDRIVSPQEVKVS